MAEGDHISWCIVPTVIAVAVLIIAVFLEFFARKNPAIRKLAETLKSGAFLSPTIISITIGFLLIISSWHNFLFAPGLGLDESLTAQIIRYSQAVIGIGLVLGLFIRYLTLGIIVLFIAGFFIFPALSMLDYLIYPGIGVFLFLIHRDVLSSAFIFHPIEKKEFLDKYRKFALPILRFLAGLGLAYAAFHHNIFDTSGALKFLQEKPTLNFMQNVFGFSNFTNTYFIFTTGVFGMLAGIILMFGLLERFSASIIGIGLLIMAIIMGWSFLPLAIPYFAVIYSVITGNQFEEREIFDKSVKPS
ncbi:hypothetical protein JW911_03775 [Candidatus Peregrinibacteria bacterium]|nr:hypothetical protein [Candidatus Peregrinibacteria bacterium]